MTSYDVINKLKSWASQIFSIAAIPTSCVLSHHRNWKLVWVEIGLGRVNFAGSKHLPCIFWGTSGACWRRNGWIRPRYSLLFNLFDFWFLFHWQNWLRWHFVTFFISALKLFMNTFSQPLFLKTQKQNKKWFLIQRMQFRKLLDFEFSIQTNQL